MPKIDISVKIKNYTEDTEYKTTGIITNKVLKYKEKDNTTTTYNYVDKCLIRNNEELYMKYIFNPKKETTGIIKIKSLKKDLNILIKTNKYKEEDNNIYIEYEIEKEKFIFGIEEIRWVY